MQNDTSKDIRLSNGKVYYLDRSEEHVSCTECSIYHDENKLCGEANAIQDCTVHVYKERIQNETREESVKTYTDKHGRVYTIVQAEGCRGCDFYKDVQACGEAPDCDGVNYKETSEEHPDNEIKEESVSTGSAQSTQKKPHKHAELIKQWADGAEIQVLSSPNGCWHKILNPSWQDDVQYRIKPEEKKPVVRWLWSYVCGGGWYTSEFFRTEEEILQEHNKDSIVKLEWSRTEFPE